MLQLDGRAVTIHRDTQEFENVEEMRVLMPWNGDSDCMIDRFDARANLDFYREPKPGAAQQTDAEKEIEQVCSRGRHHTFPGAISCILARLRLALWADRRRWSAACM